MGKACLRNLLDQWASRKHAGLAQHTRAANSRSQPTASDMQTWPVLEVFTIYGPIDLFQIKNNIFEKTKHHVNFVLRMGENSKNDYDFKLRSVSQTTWK